MDLSDFVSRVEAAKNDAGELALIAEELAALPAAEARVMRLRVLARRVALRKSEAAGAAPVTATWLSDLGLGAVDGRSLYRYNLSDKGFQDLERGLQAKAKFLQAQPDNVSAAQFVLWAAEWFRRCYDGSGLKWEALGKTLGLNAGWPTYKELTDLGLRYWRIPPLYINGSHHRIAAIARQGGFPIAAIETKGTRWAPQFLEKLVGLLMSEPLPTLEVADRIAESLMDACVPQTWRNEGIRVVSAELAMEVVRLRALVESHGVPAGALVSAWLDQNVPDWRDQLPVGVSSEASRALVDGLMKVVALKSTAGSIEVRRVLTLGDGERREQVELKLTGIICDAGGKAIHPTLADEWTRLRLYPSGEFAHHVSGELATADPSDNHWVSRPSGARAVYDLPAATPVVAELRGGGQRVGLPFVLPGGDAVVSNVRIYVAEGEEDGAKPTQFLLLGTGSGGYRPPCVYVDLPSEWLCQAHGEESIVSHFAVEIGTARVLWHVSGAAIAKSPRGDSYLIRTKQKGNTRDSLIMIGDMARGCRSSEPTMSLFLGPPRLRLRENFRERAPLANEIYWRLRGSSEWRPGLDVAIGNIQLAWRDFTTGHIRDRRDAIVLPAKFNIELRRSGDWLDLIVSGWDGAVAVDGAMAHGEGHRLLVRGGTRRTCDIILTSAEEGEISLVVPLPLDAWIETWSDGPVAANGTISLSAINRFVARVEGRCELMADLLDRDGRRVAEGMASWWVDDELPLSAISDDLAMLLRPCGDIRARVKLNFNDSHDNFWYVGEFDHRLVRDSRGWLPDRALVEQEARIVGRALHEPAKERDFGTIDLVSCLNHRPFELPALHGCWLIYLRSNERVLTCPEFTYGQDLTAAPNHSLAKAMAIRDFAARISTLEATVDAIIADPSSPASHDLLRSVIELAMSLDGLPPATFDILKLICQRPLLGALMLFRAAEHELEPILRVAEGLPFDWSLMPTGEWDVAAEAQFEYLYRLLPGELATIAPMIGDRRRALAELVPAVAPLLGQSTKPDPLFSCANGFLNRSGDLILELPSPFRPQHSDKLPQWTVRPDFWRTLDAPIAAALTARGEIELNSSQIRSIKQIHRRHPRWFREGYVAALEEL